ncbi:LysR family transcriptional regulator [Kiloniella laminariae]|uniref:LysR family transcriptional regulator n=1 Tax=Kiloniella laminariae TaxID=454162 RepID=UPI00037ED31E|nr:LysR family transcriptional regulator [Kiloniella laminariae]
MSHLDLDLRALDVFVTVVEAGGMTAASQQKGITQSAVSQAVGGLEKKMNVKLMDRAVRPPALTPAGRTLFDRAKSLLDTARETSFMVRAHQQRSLPRLNVGMVDSFGITVGPHLVKELMDEALEWSVWSGLTKLHVKRLFTREVDVVITEGSVETEERIISHRLLREPFVLALPVGYTKKIESLKALSEDIPLVRYSSRSLTGINIETHLRRLGIEARRRFEFDTADATLAMVAVGIGWAITTPLCLLQAKTHLPSIRCEPLPGPAFSRSLMLATRRHELESLQKMISKKSCEILEQRCLPEISRFAPWVIEKMHVGEKAV